MKPAHKIFFAIPFDTAIKNLYDRVSQVVRSRYPTVSTVIGNQEVGASPRYSNIASFKGQNRQLTRQFVAQIRDADLVVADLTHDNPNVHVELGIALVGNKNILRVTGRPRYPQSRSVQYRNEAELTKILVDYLKRFFAIKRLPLSNRYAQLYFREPVPFELRAPQNGLAIQSKSPKSYVLRHSMSSPKLFESAGQDIEGI